MVAKRRKYTEEFRTEAVRLYRSGDRSISAVGRELGITPSVLHRWHQEQQKAEQAGTSRASVKAEREELQRLRRENEALRQERDFLKSAAAYFAKERK